MNQRWSRQSVPKDSVTGTVTPLPIKQGLPQRDLTKRNGIQKLHDICKISTKDSSQNTYIQYIMVYLERATAHPLPCFPILEHDEYPSRKTARTGTTGSTSDSDTRAGVIKLDPGGPLSCRV